ncbi:MAG: hypothetical protein AAFV72_08940 [Cyanobacteria bacterium J06635_1]
MKLMICPGIHAPGLTEGFLRSLLPRLHQPPAALWIQPGGVGALLSAPILSTLRAQAQPSKLGPISMIAFSAGVVGAAQAIPRWCEVGGQLACLIALDGWGVPLGGDYPIYRVSHDRFTHWSSRGLGGGTVNFYAEPGIDHLDLWQTPAQAMGWRVDGQRRDRTSAADFVSQALAEANRSHAGLSPRSDRNIKDT